MAKTAADRKDRGEHFRKWHRWSKFEVIFIKIIPCFATDQTGVLIMFLVCFLFQQKQQHLMKVLNQIHLKVLNQIHLKVIKPDPPKSAKPDPPKSAKPDPPKSAKPDPPKSDKPDPPKTAKPDPLKRVNQIHLKRVNEIHLKLVHLQTVTNQMKTPKHANVPKNWLDVILLNLHHLPMMMMMKSYLHHPQAS